ncbi:MAG TPA: NUDIX hydrolase [Caulobacteraceae bacterium]|nr:NUDIX hydrolase [Caulobacteraceae bacterium]
MSSAAGPAKTEKPGLKARAQYGALPYRTSGGLEVMLITSRETGRWVIPKGWPMKGKTAPEAAAREALEEAGVEGEVDKPVGSYAYTKFGKRGVGVPCKVKVFPLKVTAQRDTWREQGEREVRWFEARAAADAVQERQLARLIRKFAKKARRAEARLPSSPSGDFPSEGQERL